MEERVGLGGIAGWGAGLLALLLLAGGIWFRCAGLLLEPLWLDEAYSAYAAAKGFHFLWHTVPLYETHPPFYYSLLRLWTLLFDNSLLGLRSLGIVCGIAALPMILLAARELGRLLRLDRTGMFCLLLGALLLASFSPPLVEMSREVRPYPLLILVYTTALFALFRLGSRSEQGQPLAGPVYFLYLVMLALTLWLHNLGPLYGVAIGIAFLALVLRPGFTRRDWAWLVGGHALVLAMYLPALLIMLDQAPTWIRSTWLKFSFDGLRAKLVTLYAAPGRLQELAALLLALLGLGALLRIKAGWRVAAALAALAIVPTALSISISATIAPVFIMRTMTAIAIPTFLLLAAGAAVLPGFWRLPAIGALILIASQMISIDLLARRGGPSQDWYGTVRWLAERFRPGDRVYAYPNEGALPFDLAASDLGLDLPSRAIPTPVPSLNIVGGWNPTGSRGVVSLPRDRLRAIAQSPEANAVPTIWLLRLGPWAYDRGDMFLDELGRGRTRVGQWRRGPIDLVGLRKLSPDPAGRAAAAAGR